MPDPIPPHATRLPAAALVLSLLGGCGSATGELPVGRDVSRPDGTPAGAFGDPVSPSGASSVAAVDTLDAALVGRAPLPASEPAPDEALADPVSIDPFEIPDPTASTLIARLGFAPLAELADAFVAARYVDDYLAVDADVLAFVAPDGVETEVGRETLACPDGGSVRVGRETRLGRRVLELGFERCAFGGTTLSGALVRSASRDVFPVGAHELLELDYRNLAVRSGTRATTLSGATNRGTLRRAVTPCDGENVELSLVHRIDAASVTRDGRTVRVVDARHVLDRASVLSTPDGERASCGERTTSVFDGRARVSGGAFGATRATIHRHGSLVRDARAEREPPSDAMLRVDAEDGSSLSLRLLSDRDATAQVDVFADAVAASFTVGHRFAP